MIQREYIRNGWRERNLNISVSSDSFYNYVANHSRWLKVGVMTLYVKYDKKPPHLPVAVADSKKELAQILGISFDCVASSYSHKRRTFQEVDVEMSDIELYNVELYPDNDGGLWYWHPVTGKTIYVRD